MLFGVAVWLLPPLYGRKVILSICATPLAFFCLLRSCLEPTVLAPDHSASDFQSILVTSPPLLARSPQQYTVVRCPRSFSSGALCQQSSPYRTTTPPKAFTSSRTRPLRNLELSASSTSITPCVLSLSILFVDILYLAIPNRTFYTTKLPNSAQEALNLQSRIPTVPCLHRNTDLKYRRLLPTAPSPQTAALTASC